MLDGVIPTLESTVVRLEALTGAPKSVGVPDSMVVASEALSIADAAITMEPLWILESAVVVSVECLRIAQSRVVAVESAVVVAAPRLRVAVTGAVVMKCSATVPAVPLCSEGSCAMERPAEGVKTTRTVRKPTRSHIMDGATKVVAPLMGSRPECPYRRVEEAFPVEPRMGVAKVVKIVPAKTVVVADHEKKAYCRCEDPSLEKRPIAPISSVVDLIGIPARIYKNVITGRDAFIHRRYGMEMLREGIPPSAANRRVLQISVSGTVKHRCAAGIHKVHRVVGRHGILHYVKVVV
jgi:hypothetical protein